MGTQSLHGCLTFTRGRDLESSRTTPDTDMAEYCKESTAVERLTLGLNFRPIEEHGYSNSTGSFNTQKMQQVW